MAAGFAVLLPSLRSTLHSNSSCVCCAESSKPVSGPPTSLESTVSLATRAITNAIEDGHSRLLVTALIPGLNPAIEQTFPFSSSLLNTLSKSLVTNTPLGKTISSESSSLLFPSTGAAAAAAAQYSRDAKAQDINTNDAQNVKDSDGLEPLIKTSSYASRDALADRTSSVSNIIINPVTNRGDPIMDDLETVISENPLAKWLLLNPDFGVDRAAVGMRESSRRTAFLESFEMTFYFRNLVGSILHNAYYLIIY